MLQQDRRIHGVVLAAAAALSLAVTGCGQSGGSLVNAILEAQLDLVGDTAPNPNETVRIQVINQTTRTVELDLLVDGLPQTISCDPSEARCAFVPAECPGVVEAVQERELNEDGAFVGGRNFNGNPVFIFTDEEFQCGAVILFTFTDLEATAQVL
jgi:hypothetical protein